jgi:hypothetical protein
MDKINSAFHGSNGFLLKQGNRNNLLNLKSFNELKKDQTNIKIFKNSSFDSNFNSVQSLNTNLSQFMHLPSFGPHFIGGCQIKKVNSKVKKGGPLLLPCSEGSALATKNIKNFKFTAILRAIRSIRLNRDEWKLIRYINLMGKKIRSSPFFGCFAPAQSFPKQYAAPYLTYSQARQDRKNLKKKRKLNLDKIKKLQNVNPCLVLARVKKPYNAKATTPIDRGLRQGEENKYFYNIISKNILLRNMKYNFLKSTLSSILKKKIRKISEILEDKPIKNYVLYSYLKNCISSLRLGTQNHLNKEAGPWGGRTKLSLNKYKGRKFGSFINYNKIIGYKFTSTFYPGKRLDKSRAGLADTYIKNTYKLLFYLFKSMHCLISKPVLKYSNDKVTIQLFYYLNIPKKKVFRLFSIFYINSIKKKWLALIEKKKTGEYYHQPSDKKAVAYGNRNKIGGVMDSKVGNTKIYIRWKLRKAISRLKNKIITSSYLPGLWQGSGATSGKNWSATPCPLAFKNTKERQGGQLRQSFPNIGSARSLGGGGGALSLISSSQRLGPLTPKDPKGRGQKNLLFKLRKFNLTAKAVFQKKFKLICAILSNKFNKPVELQLIRLHHPYHDSNILVNLLSLNIKNKRKKARVAVQKIYNKKPVKNLNDPNLNYPNARLEKQGITIDPTALAGEVNNFIPAFLSGLNIKIAGRLMREPIIPRITTKVFQKGSSAIGKVNYLDVARITKKNRKGAYTIKISSGQNFF